MEDRPIVFEVTKEQIDQMAFGDLILFVSSANIFLSLENFFSKDLMDDAKEESIEKMMKVDQLLSYAKECLNQWS